MSKSQYPRTYRAIELFEAAQRELTAAMESEMGDGLPHGNAPAVLVVVNDPARGGSFLTALGRFDRMAAALVTVLEDPTNKALNVMVMSAMLAVKLRKQAN